MCFSCFVSSNGIVFPPPSDSADVWMPRSINYMNMVDSLHNVGGLLNKYDIRRNIELIASENIVSEAVMMAMGMVRSGT